MLECSWFDIQRLPHPELHISFLISHRLYLFSTMNRSFTSSCFAGLRSGWQSLSLTLRTLNSPSLLLLFSWPQRGRTEIEIHPNKNQQPQSGWTRVLIDLTTRNIPPSTPAGGYTGQSNNRSLILKSNARMFMIRYSKTPIPRTPLFQIGAQKLSDY